MYNEIGFKDGTYDRTVYSTVEDMQRFLSEAENLGCLLFTENVDDLSSGVEYNVGACPIDMTYFNSARNKEKSLFFGDYRNALFSIYKHQDKDDFVKVELKGTKLHQWKRVKK